MFYVKSSQWLSEKKLLLVIKTTAKIVLSKK